MKNYFIIFLSLFLFISCTEESNPLKTKSSNNEIIGTWKSDWQIISFYEDSTFTDSMYICNLLIDTIPRLHHVINGNYTINGNILEYKNFYIAYLDSTTLGASLAPWFKEISFSNDSLLLTSLNILDLVDGKDNELWGTWTVTHNSYHCKNNPLESQYIGRQKYTYKFLKDTAIVEYKWEDIDSESKQLHKFYCDYSYVPPYLDLDGPGYYDLKVEFKNSKMYWYYLSQSFIRIQ